MTALLPPPLPVDAPSRPRVRRFCYEPVPGQPPPNPVPAPRSAGPPARPALEPLDAHRAAHRAARRILRIALEVLDHRRPHAQLAGHFATGPLRYWRVVAWQRTVHGPARHGPLRLCLPRAGVAEVAATCRVDGRVRALAARFEQTDGGWQCTAVRLG